MKQHLDKSEAYEEVHLLGFDAPKSGKRSASAGLHGVTSQTTVLFIDVDSRTSHSTRVSTDPHAVITYLPFICWLLNDSLSQIA
jgi:hypothetical protein